MAKLSARGRKELWRIRKDFDIVALEARQSRYNEKNGTDFENSWSREFIEYAFMSDGHLLKHIVSWYKGKLSYLYNPPRMIEDRYDFGWKDLGIRDKLMADTLLRQLIEKGYKEV